MDTAYPQQTQPAENRAAELSPSGGQYTGGDTGDQAPAPGRSAHFGAGVLGHQLGSMGLAQAQANYDSVLPGKYSVGAGGLLSKTENVASSLSTGLSPDDPRSSAYNGTRWTQTSPVGRSASTALSEPQFKQEGEA